MKQARRWTGLVFIVVIMAAALPPVWGAPTAARDKSTREVGSGYLENITFEKLPGKERVIFAVSKPSGVTVENQPGNALVVRLENLFVPEGLRRPLDDASLANVIWVTPVQKAAEGRSWVLAVIELRQKVPYSVRQEGRNVIVDFNVTFLASAAESALKKPLSPEQPIFPEQPMIVQSLVETSAAPVKSVPKETAAADAKEKKVYTDSRIFLDVQDADIKSVFRLLAEQGNVSIAYGDDVKGTVTLSIKDVPWNQALNTVLGIKGLSRIDKANVITVMSTENFLKLKNAEEALAKKAEEKAKKDEEERAWRERKRLDEEPLITRIIPIKYRMLKLAAATVDDKGQKKETEIKFKQDMLLSSISGESATVAGNSKGLTSAGGSALSLAGSSLQQNKFSPGVGSPGEPAVEEKKIEDTVSFIQFLHNFLSRDADGKRRGWIGADSDTNSIIITAIKRDVDIILDMIAKTDIPTDQVLIKANIVETTKDMARSVGIQWGGVLGRSLGSQNMYLTPGGVGGSATPPGSVLSGGYTPATGSPGIGGQGYGVNFPASDLLGTPAAMGLIFGTIGANMLELQLSALQNDGKLNILSSPSLMTLDNQTASTESGEDIPFVTPATAQGPATVTWKKAVLRLEITPHVIDRKYIKMTIIVRKDLPNYSRKIEGNPPIFVKETRTELVVADGETIVISGFTQQMKTDDTSGVPWLKDIPVLGWLFKNNEKTEAMDEVLIFITPSLIKSQEISEIQTGL